MSLEDVLYETLGSEKTGNALDALPDIAENLRRITYLLEELVKNETTTEDTYPFD
jgi:hypothetical protein